MEFQIHFRARIAPPTPDRKSDAVPLIGMQARVGHANLSKQLW